MDEVGRCLTRATRVYYRADPCDDAHVGGARKMSLAGREGGREVESTCANIVIRRYSARTNSRALHYHLGETCVHTRRDVLILVQGCFGRVSGGRAR